jgi:hypothetical protein
MPGPPHSAHHRLMCPIDPLMALSLLEQYQAELRAERQAASNRPRRPSRAKALAEAAARDSSEWLTPASAATRSEIGIPGDVGCFALPDDGSDRRERRRTMRDHVEATRSKHDGADIESTRWNAEGRVRLLALAGCLGAGAVAIVLSFLF